MGNDEGIPEDAGFWWKLIHLNPALWRALIVAVVALLGAIGIAVNGSLEDSIFLFITAAAAIAQGLWTRGAVTANQKVVVYKPDPVDEPGNIQPGPSVVYDSKRLADAGAATVDPASM